MNTEDAVRQARSEIYDALQKENIPLSSKGVDFIDAAIRAAIKNVQKNNWYTVEELRHALRTRDYSEQIADELATLYADNLNGAHRKGMQQGLQRAIQAITPQNPMATSPNTETRNACCREIRKVMEAET